MAGKELAFFCFFDVSIVKHGLVLCDNNDNNWNWNGLYAGFEQIRKFLNAG